MARVLTRVLATWGNGDFGRLGHGVECVSEELPRVVAALRDHNVLQVACGGAHTAVVTESGAVFTMGLNDYGQLGHTPKAHHAPVPQQVALPEAAMAVSAGHFHTLALTVSGSLWAWGRNWHGQLGLGSDAGSVEWQPVLVKALLGSRVVAVDAGMEHSLAVTAEGKVFSWGAGGHGRLGHGTSSLSRWLAADQSTPRQVRALDSVRVTQVAAADTSSGCVDDDGCMHTWGNGRFWQLAQGKSIPESATPLQVPGAREVSALSLGGLYGAAVGPGGELMMWGTNESGVLGMGPNSASSLRQPTRVPNFMCEQVASGWKHCAALTGHGALYTWGWGGSMGSTYGFEGGPGSTGGQLGLGNEFDYWQPTQVEWLQLDDTDVRRWRGDPESEDDPSCGRGEWRFQQVSAGFNHTAAVVDATHLQ